MDKLTYDLVELTRRNRDGSFTTQSQRQKILKQISRDLKSLGFKTNTIRATDLRGKHVTRLVDHWRNTGLSTGTIKNRLSALRWWAGKVDRASVIPRDNAALGVDRRVYVTNNSKSVRLTTEHLERVQDPGIRLSLRLQSEFGLRREEAQKFCVSEAEHGDELRLRASWCKGGRARTIPVRTDEQRQLLAEIREHAGDGSLIPPGESYRQHVKRYEYQTSSAGLGNTHGLRHDYAQRRYVALTGRQPPACGGARRRELSAEDYNADLAARQVITEELGHSRISITAIYLGS